MTDYVLDASVLVKWAVPEQAEEDTGKALDLLADFELGKINLLQPIHWLCEVVAVLCRISAPTLNRKIHLLRALEIPVIDNPAIFQSAGELAVKLDHHLFDTLYHAVALENHITLVTADIRYYRKSVHIGHIQLLSDV